MKTKKLLRTTFISIMMMFIGTFLTNAQIPFQSFDVPNEGIAIWDADGSGPEAEAYGHVIPFGWGSARYYGASRDYDNIDTSANAALAHVTDTIIDFPLFVQALTDNGFSPGQVKIKASVYNNEADLEGADWFTFDNTHYYNRYNGNMFLELSGEPLIKCHFDFLNIRNDSAEDFWSYQTNFATPLDDSENSSDGVKTVAEAFLMDMEDAELRLIVDNLQYTGQMFSGNGRINGSFFNIYSGYLEKGQMEFPFTGLANDHEGVAIWDADGSGPEPEAEGHTFYYDSIPYQMSYYLASRDYDDIDPDTNAAFTHFTAGAIGFPNTAVQLTYRGYTLDQLKSKTGLTSYGNDIEGMDWGLDSNIYWYNYYAVPVTIEIAGEPILELVVDSSFCFRDMDVLFADWWNYSTLAEITDISANTSDEAQAVAYSFMRDLGNHWVNFSMEGDYAGSMISENGREGEFHEISEGKMIGAYHDTIWENVYKPAATFSGMNLITYPNPFFSLTTIEYELQFSTSISISIYNQVGELIEELHQNQSKGKHSFIWKADALPVGVYYCVLKTKSSMHTVKMIKLK